MEFNGKAWTTLHHTHHQTHQVAFILRLRSPELDLMPLRGGPQGVCGHYVQQMDVLLCTTLKTPQDRVFLKCTQYAIIQSTKQRHVSHTRSSDENVKYKPLHDCRLGPHLKDSLPHPDGQTDEQTDRQMDRNGFYSCHRAFLQSYIWSGSRRIQCPVH